MYNMLTNQATDLRVDGLSMRYSSPRGSVDALQGVSFHVSAGEFVALVGPSGCGKSTLLRIVAGLQSPDLGEIAFPGRQTAPKCRFVFQNHALFPWMTVRDNVSFGLEMDGMPDAERRAVAAEQLTALGLADFMDHYPHELSGGMCQRAAIAQAFVTRPDVLLMDEPLRALDAQMRMVIQEDLLALWERTRPTVLYVTHDIEEALLLADRVLVMSGRPGRIREAVKVPFGRPRDLTGRNHQGIEELKWRIWKMLEQEVKQQLLMSRP
jgi:NitT/TauT family transport system ATP-binding protein